MMRVMKKSIGDNMIPKDWAFERGLDLVKKSGFDGIELWLGDVPWFQMTTTDAEVRELRRKVENAGLVVSNVSTGLHWASPLSARDPRGRAQAARIVERQIETARLLGSDAILVVAGLVTDEVPYNEVYQRCLDALRPLGDTAARAGVKIGCENCNAEQRFLLSPREFWQFLNDVNSPAVGIHLDVGNIHDTGFAEQWIEMHGPRITRIHLKDVLKHRGRSGDQSVYTNLFLGDNNWPAIRAALTKVGYDGWLIAEMEARYRCAPLIVPGALDISPAVARAIVAALHAGATVILESAAGFIAEQDFRAHRAVLRDALGVHIDAAQQLWPRSVPYIDFGWPYVTKLRDFSRVVRLAAQPGAVIASVDGFPVALKRFGPGTLIFLGSPVGPALWSGDVEARAWLSAVLATAS